MARTLIVAEGVDVLARELTVKAATVQPQAARTVVEYAGRAAQRMRERVSVLTGEVQSSISSDSAPSVGDGGVYADAGPEHFVARFLENGTVKMSPRPFVGPAADQTVPEFAEAVADLGGF